MRRREFLKAAAATIAAPYFVPARAFGANERVVVGCIGVVSSELTYACSRPVLIGSHDAPMSMLR